VDGEVEVETKQAAILVAQNYIEDYIADLRSITEYMSGRKMGIHSVRMCG
jgi:hypothetical protein